MPRKSPFHIDLSVEEECALQQRAAKYTLPYFEVQRAKMILMATLAAQELFSNGQLYRRCAAWYPKPQATFSDTIACVRRALWSHAYFSTSHNEADMVKIPRPLVDRFIDSLCYAA